MTELYLYPKSDQTPLNEGNGNMLISNMISTIEQGIPGT